MQTSFDVHFPKLHEKQSDFVLNHAKRNMIRAGRRSGKTTGIADLAGEKFLENKRVLYSTPTQEQVDRFWYVIKDIFREPLEQGIFYKNESKHIIEIPNTTTRIRAKTAWNADTLRGDYADVLIMDEFQLMDEEALALVGYPMLADNNGDLFLIYTPPSIESMPRSKAKNPRFVSDLFKKAQSDTTGRWKTYSFTSYDNPHISKEAIDALAEDMNSVAFRMEIMAEDVDSALGALWNRKMIEDYRVLRLPPNGCSRIVVGVDPSESSVGNEAGVVTAGIDANGEYYIIGDQSIQGSPLIWAQEVVNSFHKYEADRVIAEGNAGGEMVKSVINQVDPTVPVQIVYASRSKQTRASPVATLAEKGKIHHVGNFPKLEDELCLWIPGRNSPNRLDAMVWAVTFLMQSGKLKSAQSRQG